MAKKRRVLSDWLVAHKARWMDQFRGKEFMPNFNPDAVFCRRAPYVPSEKK